MERIPVPTGDILIVDGCKGKLECLSLGDYGKAVNLNQHKRVEHGPLLPLTEKWVCTVSTQYGCSSGCKFCDVPLVGPGVNASFGDIMGQIQAVASLHPEVTHCDRLNVHYARMGEPTWNPAVLETARVLREIEGFKVHPVVSTMMPRNNRGLAKFIAEWVEIKNVVYGGEAGLQLSINSTDEAERDDMFSSSALPLADIASIMATMPDPVGRKYTLNFAIAEYTIDADLLAILFPPERFICKITPMHKTATALDHGIETRGDYTEPYPYDGYEARLRAAGFEVLVFIASREEDESRITCGNAILGLRKGLLDISID